MERFFSQENIERCRKLLDMSNDEPERRLMLNFLAAQTRIFLFGLFSQVGAGSRIYVMNLAAYGTGRGAHRRSGSQRYLRR